MAKSDQKRSVRTPRATAPRTRGPIEPSTASTTIPPAAPSWWMDKNKPVPITPALMPTPLRGETRRPEELRDIIGRLSQVMAFVDRLKADVKAIELYPGGHVKMWQRMNQNKPIGQQADEWPVWAHCWNSLIRDFELTQQTATQLVQLLGDELNR